MLRPVNHFLATRDLQIGFSSRGVYCIQSGSNLRPPSCGVPRDGMMLGETPEEVLAVVGRRENDGIWRPLVQGSGLVPGGSSLLRFPLLLSLPRLILWHK